MIQIYQFFNKLQKTLVEMIKKIDKTPQLEIFKTPLEHFIKENHELVLLSKKMDWDNLDVSLSIYYCADNGRPCITSSRRFVIKGVRNL